MNDKPIPKHQIREKKPENEIDIVSDKKLIKKLKKERLALDKEKSEWEKLINQIENYNDSLKDVGPNGTQYRKRIKGKRVMIMFANYMKPTDYIESVTLKTSQGEVHAGRLPDAAPAAQEDGQLEKPAGDDSGPWRQDEGRRCR